MEGKDQHLGTVPLDPEQALKSKIHPSSMDRTPTLSGSDENDTQYDNVDEVQTISLSRTATNAAGKEGMFARTLSLVRTKDSGRDPGPPPDGGFNAWFQAILAHFVIMNTWGYINSFGVFQSYYTATLNRPPSDISWVGSMQIFLLFFIGTFSGRATDAGYFKAVWGVGTVILMIGIFMTSLCTTYWQLFLSQGLCMGIGSGFIFCPTIALTSTYFSSKRGMALAFAACGSATGGLIFPAVVRELLPRIGFPWTMRVLGFITLATSLPGFFFFRQRLPPRTSGPLFELAAFKEMEYSLYAIGMFLNFWSLYVGFFYVSSFGRDIVGLSQSKALDVLLIMNGVGTVGRMIPSVISDYYTGPFNALIPFAFGTGIVSFIWIAIDGVGGLYAFAVLYGFFGAGIQALFPVTAASLTTDMKKIGVRFGMLLSIVSFASLTGAPIAGALIQLKDGDYMYAQIFAGLSTMVGTTILVMARCAMTGFVLKVRA
ncbi:hypothetical protein AJ80_07427 [Polytolypa hystricis UAMH7299]|uniref:Major facilitator superfamily (MFS) profile domain-containing protein n=1 Tax=Polytolypa hystricis (strain UAMH7299) TaxID=1447883 RepID=A0A2B7XPH0_POLH7|nr:hypothetical protein AJ80_07427 [Polytolypa hystricis UAMH7299]